MRHGKKFNHLGRTASHRKALLMNMANSLIEHKRITTTLAKARELRKYVEPLITKSKNDTTHSRRVVFSYLKHKEPIKILFGEIAEKVADRPGGYTRIIKLPNRVGDNAEMAMIELVDYNEMYTQTKSTESGGGKRRRRRKKSASAETEAAAVAEASVETEANEDEEGANSEEAEKED